MVRGSWPIVVVGSSVLLGLGLTLPNCNAETQVEACERLRHYSCECFGVCQTGDRSAVDSGEGDTCDARLRQDFEAWQVCASGIRASGQRCDETCLLAWGACAFDAYRQAGLAPTNMCVAGDGG
jgi:hypothetical protein